MDLDPTFFPLTHLTLNCDKWQQETSMFFVVKSTKNFSLTYVHKDHKLEDSLLLSLTGRKGRRKVRAGRTTQETTARICLLFVTATEDLGINFSAFQKYRGEGKISRNLTRCELLPSRLGSLGRLRNLQPLEGDALLMKQPKYTSWLQIALKWHMFWKKTPVSISTN